MSETFPAARQPLFTRPFMRLWWFSFFTFATAFQLFPTIPFRIVELGGTKAQAGFFLATYTYACAFSAPITGALADHFGRRRLLTLGSIAFVFASAMYGVITSIPLLLFFACIHGVVWSSILSSAAAVMAEIMPASRRTEGMGYWGMASNVAVSVAPLIGLTLYRSRVWTFLTMEMSALALVMVVMALRVRGGDAVPGRSTPQLSALIDWRVMTAGLALFVFSFSYGGITSYVAMLALERNLHPPSLFFSLFAISILVTRLFTGRIGDRIGPKRLFIPAVLVIPVALVILAYAQSNVSIVISAVIYGAGFGAAYPAFIAYVLELTDESRRGSTFGSVLWAFDTGIGTGSLVTGVLVQQSGYTFALLVGAAISTLSVPVFVATSKLLKKRIED